MRVLAGLMMAAVLAMTLPPIAAQANDRVEAQALVDKAKTTVDLFAADPNMQWMRDNFEQAKAVLVVPSSIKGGFIIGASGGQGVLLVRGDGEDGWTYPAFYRLGSVTFGLQIGGEVSELVLMVMTENGVDALLASSFKLGGDVSIAAGPVGVGAKAQTTDVLAFARSKGLYGGINLEGAIVKVNNAYNEAYYRRRDVRPRDIIVSKDFINPDADPLRRSLDALGD